MATSSYTQARSFKSRLDILVGCLLKSRDGISQRLREQTKKLQAARREIKARDRELLRVRQSQGNADRRIKALEAENEQLRSQPILLPNGPCLPHHTYQPDLISLATTLARQVGLRAAEKTLKTVFFWLGIESRVPCWTTIRNWLCRIGVASLNSNEPADDWIWLVDHSNQIGAEKVLVILGIRASQLPPSGQALRHEDMHVLAVIPGVNWKIGDVAREYKALAAQLGAPVAVIADGASELRDSVESLRKTSKNILVLYDFKHYAANVLKRVIGNDAQYQEFHSRLGQSRSAIQQTELAHFTPPSQKFKARFMNLAATLKWAEAISWHLAHPYSEGRGDITVARMNEKLGWLRKYRNGLKRWRNCQAVVSLGVTIMNEEGLSLGAADHLAQKLAGLSGCKTSRQVATQLVQFVRDMEAQLNGRQRFPLSTEILESSFGLYKELEKQHSKGGFTSLLAAFGALLKPITPEVVATAFRLVSNAKLKIWVKEKLGATLNSKRNAAYRECRPNPVTT